MAPINGLYGIEAEDGSVSVWNSGELFGAIDVALFILVIGGFLGVTMKTGRDPGRDRADRRAAARAARRLMIPILMTVFALGGTTYGMAEESLAFYALIITVMIAAGYDALVGGVRPPARLRHRRARLDRSTRSRPASPRGSPASRIDEGIVGRLVILVVGTAIGICLRDALRRPGEGRSEPLAGLRQKAENEAQFRATTETAGSTAAALTGAPEGRPRAVRPGLRRDDLRRHPVGGPRHQRSRPCGGGSRR